MGRRQTEQERATLTVRGLSASTGPKVAQRSREIHDKLSRGEWSPSVALIAAGKIRSRRSADQNASRPGASAAESTIAPRVIRRSHEKITSPNSHARQSVRNAASHLKIPPEKPPIHPSFQTTIWQYQSALDSQTR